MKRYKISKYKCWYDQIIDHAKDRNIQGYCERHHIKPIALGGVNNTSNIVKLTFREHFLVHWLLTKFTTGNAQKKMQHALNMMRRKRKGRIVSSWQYAAARKAFCEAQKDFKHKEESKRKIGVANSNRKYPNPRRGWKHTEEALQKMRKPRKLHTDEAKAAMSVATLGKKKTKKHRRNLRVAAKARWARERALRPPKPPKVKYVRTAEHNRKIGLGNKGKVFTVERKRLIGLVHKGRKDTPATTKRRSASQKGRRHPEETILKMKASALLREARKRAALEQGIGL